MKKGRLRWSRPALFIFSSGNAQITDQFTQAIAEFSE